jgi:hypothetical protein
VKQGSGNAWPLGDDPLSLWAKRRRLQADSERQLARIALEVGQDVPQQPSSTAAGDPRRLRGIPALARGVGGTLAGSDPYLETIRKERSRNDGER